MLLALALISSAADCPTTAIRSPWPGYGTMVHTSSGLELVFADEAGTAIQTLDDAGRLVGEPRRLQYGPALRDVAAAGDLLVFSGPDQPVIAVDATTGARRFEVQLPDEPGLSTPTVLVAAGDGELGVAWERWLQRPDRGAALLLFLAGQRGAARVKPKAMTDQRCISCHAGGAAKPSGTPHRCALLKEERSEFSCARCHAKQPPPADAAEECSYVERRSHECGACHMPPGGPGGA